MATDIDAMRAHIGQGIPTVLPVHPGISEDVDHAPARRQILSSKEKKTIVVFGSLYLIGDVLNKN